MWDQSDFESLREEYQNHARDFTKSGSNSLTGRTLFVTAHALHQFHADLEIGKGEHVNERHHMQLLFLERGIRELLSLYWLAENYSYTACQGRLRFLLETYTLVRELNNDKEKTKRDFVEIVEETAKNEYDPSDSKPLTDYLSGKRRQVRGDLAKGNKVHSDVYNQMSNIGSHPHSIQSMGLDGEHDSDTEQDYLEFGLVFVYALAAQYRRTFEDTSLRNWVEQELDGIMLQAQLRLGGLPLFLKEDMDYTTISESS